MKIFAAYRVLCGITLTALGCGGCTTQQDTQPSAARIDNNDGEIVRVVTMQKMNLSTPVLARGTMVEKCPVAGCWFMLHDKTGIIKVDLKATKQNVVNIPLNSEVTVRGKVAQNGSQKMIQAVSATF